MFDTKLCGNIDIPGIGVLSTYTDKIEQISATADAAAAGLIDESRDRISADQALAQRIDAISLSGISADLERVVGQVSVQLSTAFDGKLSTFQNSICATVDAKFDAAIAHTDALCIALSTQISATNEALTAETARRSADCQFISSQVDNLCSDLGAEAINRKETDIILSNQIIAAE